MPHSREPLTFLVLDVARLIRQAGAPCDHPIHPMLPESAYLKALAYALD